VSKHNGARDFFKIRFSQRYLTKSQKKELNIGKRKEVYWAVAEEVALLYKLVQINLIVEEW